MLYCLPWIHHECKIKASYEPMLFKTPDFFNLTPDTVSLYRSTEMTDRNHHNPINFLVIARNNHFHALTGKLPTIKKYPVNLWLFFYDLKFSKASSHRIPRAFSDPSLFVWQAQDVHLW